MPALTNVDVVRAVFESYLAQDRDAADRLIAEDFAFTSPQDDHIDKVAFFERCFPTAEHLKSQDILKVVPTEGDDVFVLYVDGWPPASSFVGLLPGRIHAQVTGERDTVVGKVDLCAGLIEAGEFDGVPHPRVGAG